MMVNGVNTSDNGSIISSSPPSNPPVIMIKLIIVGNLVHTPVCGEIEILRDHICAVDTNGVIQYIHPFPHREIASSYPSLSSLFPSHLSLRLDCAIHILDSYQFIMCGFCDTHIHAPQYAFSGAATDRPLMEWLKAYAIPAEKSFHNIDTAKLLYDKLVKSLLKHGTTSAVYFSSIHLEATKVLCDIVNTYGQRALIGKTCMDQNSPDSEYQETTQNAISHTIELIEYIRSLHTPLIQPMVVPRFIPTCSLELLSKLGEIAKEKDVAITTHAAESNDEVELVSSLHPDLGNGRDIAILDQCGLLNQKSIMAHCVQITQDEMNVMKSKGAAVSHCPLSNYYLSNDVLPIKALLKNQNKVSLGTDIAGGVHPSLLHSMRHAITTSFAANNVHKKYQLIDQDTKHPPLSVSAHKNDLSISWREALYVATKGGAESIGHSHDLGLFKQGYQFDALLIDTCPSLKARTDQHQVNGVGHRNGYLSCNGSDRSKKLATGEGGMMLGNTPRCINGESDPFHVWGFDTLDDLIERFINLGDDRNIAQVWVAGRPVKYPNGYK